MAASNATVPADSLGRARGARELTAAHLLGFWLRCLIRWAYNRPSAPAAWLLPDEAAKACVFYRARASRSVSELLVALS